MSLSNEDRGRRLAAKRYNERLKLTATGFNAVAIAVVSVAVVLPGINTRSLLLTGKPWLLLFGAIVLHTVGQVLLGLIRSED